MTRLSAGLPFVVVALLAGCPKNGGGSADAGTDAPAEAGKGELAPSDDEVRAVYPVDAGPPPPVVARLCAALHDLPEQRRAACCAEPAALVVTSQCERTLTAAMALKAVTLDAADVESCERAIRAAYEGCDWVGPFPPEVPDACLGIVRGQLAAGKRCRSSLECAAPLRCHGVGPTTPGRCGPGSADGEKCNGSADPLAGYTRQNDVDTRHPECSGWCNRTKCAALADAGAACTLGAACGAGKLCVSGKCAAASPAKVGEPCPGDACEKGAQCIQGKCAAKKAAGATCATDFECKGGCLKGDGGAKGTCGKKCGSR